METRTPRAGLARPSRKPGRKWTIIALLVVFTSITIAAGAAAGNVMGTGRVDGNIPLTVSQALFAKKPVAHSIPAGRRFFSSVSDDDTKFSFAIEIFRGETQTVLLPIKNRSSNDTVAEFSVIVPDIPSLIEGVPGLTIDVAGSGAIDDVVRISPDSWTFTAPALIDGPPDGLLITVKVAPTSIAGYFVISGRVRSTEF